MTPGGDEGVGQVIITVDSLPVHLRPNLENSDGWWKGEAADGILELQVNTCFEPSQAFAGRELPTKTGK